MKAAAKKPATPKVIKKVEVNSLLSPEEIEAEAAFESAKKHLEEIRSGRKAEIVRQIKALVKAYELDVKSIFPNATAEPKTATGFKYFDPVSGLGWSGKGQAKPVFAEAKKKGTLEKYLVSEKKS